MMRIRLLIGGLILIGGLGQQVFAEQDNTGGKAGAFLRMGIGARPMAMGGAFVSVADDGTSAYWNPAGLVQLDKMEISSMYMMSSLDRKYNFLNYATPIKNKESIQAGAISIINTGVGNIRERDTSDVYLGKFNEEEYAFLLSYARVMGEKMAIGLNFKYLLNNFVGVRQGNGENKGKGTGLDVGLLYKASDDVLIGLMCQDIGSFMKWETEHVDYLPLDVRLGCSVSFLQGKMTMSIEGEKIEDRKGAKFHFGTEYWLLNGGVGLRAGVNDTYPSVGLGIKLPISKADLHLDYSFGPDRFSEFKDEIDASKRYNHRFSLRVEF